MPEYKLPKDMKAFWQPDLPRTAGQAWMKLPREQQEETILHATEFMGLLPWRGAKKTVIQNLAWPRSGVILDDGTLLADNIVPDKVKECSIVVSYFIGAKIPFDIPAMTHVMLMVGHLLIPTTDIRNGDIRPWNSSTH